MKHPVVSVGVLILIVAGASAFRLAHLDNRPMHTDEAVHGMKFVDLLENGKYKYNPDEYHGPSLNYLTVGVARLGGAENRTQTSELHLRLVPAIFGIVLVAGLWLVKDALGRAATLCAATLGAVSPAMVFYSRYYIQEMLLVCFTFFAIAALWRSARRESTARIAWLLVAGISVGLMHATKETCIIAFFSMVVAGIGVAMLSLCAGNGWTRRKAASLAIAGAVILGVGAAISVVLFSSLLTNASGPADSITTFFHYFQQAGGQGSTGDHSYPWYNYLRIVLWWQVGDSAVWTEAAVVVLAVVGLIAGLLGKGCGKASIPFVRFLCIYTLVMTVVYSAITYKTPWCLLSFFHGMILLAGLGAAVLLRITRPAPLKAFVAVVLLAAAGHLAWQGWRASFPQNADPGNPYVYAHPTHDVPELARLIRDIAEVHPEKHNMLVQIVCPDNHPWPFPWYLRDFTQVDWYGQAPKPPVLIYPVDVMPVRLLQLPPYDRVTPETKAGEEPREWWELRPNVRIEARVAPDLLKEYNASRGGGE